MSYLLKVRENADLKQAEAARQMGVSRQFLGRLEQGQSLPSAEQAEVLRKFYGLPVLEAAHLLDQYERRRTLCPYALELVDSTPWRTTHDDHGFTLQALGLDPALWQWMTSFLPADVPRECFALGQVASLGARPMLGNPNHWDFLEHVVVDHLGKLPGCRVFPGLLYASGDSELWLWPQMRLRIDARTWFRLDGLVGYRKASRRFWLGLEWDGAGRDLRRDAFRTERLGMLEVRITNQEIGELRTTALLFERIESAIAAHLANPGLLKNAAPRLMRVNRER